MNSIDDEFYSTHILWTSSKATRFSLLLRNDNLLTDWWNPRYNWWKWVVFLTMNPGKKITEHSEQGEINLEIFPNHSLSRFTRSTVPSGSYNTITGSFPNVTVNYTVNNCTCNLSPFSSFPFSTLRPTSPVWNTLTVWHITVKLHYLELSGTLRKQPSFFAPGPSGATRAGAKKDGCFRRLTLSGAPKIVPNSGSSKKPIVNDWNSREMGLSSQWRGIRNNRVRINGVQQSKTKTKDSFLPVHQKCPFDEHELWPVFRTWHALLLLVLVWWSRSTRSACLRKTGFSHPWSTKKGTTLD